MITYLLALAVLISVMAVTSLVLMIFQAFRSRIIAEEIVLESLPVPFDGFRILFITDIHRRRLPAALLTPLTGMVDAVLAGGDLTEDGSPLPRLADNMALLASIAPLYAVHGNHDYRADTIEVDQIIRSSGGHLLIDENVVFVRQDATLLVTGVDYPPRGGKHAYAPLPAPPRSSRDDCCRIVLVHDPFWLKQYPEVPADLVLAGHTHGGQVVLPFIGRRHIEAFYRHFSAGFFQWPKAGGDKRSLAKVLISRGFGTAHLPLRWGSPAEIHVLTLRRK